jgi:hypothetical protein
MIRRVTLGAATALLIVGLPVAALGSSQSFDDASTPSVTPVATELSQEMELEAQGQIGTPPVDAVQAEAQEQVRERQRAQEHIETGIPDDVDPIQTQTRASKQTHANTHENTGTQAHGQAQAQAGDGETRGVAPTDGTGHQHGQNGDAPKGNAGAEQSGDCTNDGECAYDGNCPNA